MYGAKADNLIKLRDAGIRVPGFTVVRFEEVVDTDRLEAEDVRGALKSGWKEKLSLSPSKAYAVRSSCNLEDSGSSSFAGQFDTFLNVKAVDVEEKVISCIKSLYKDSVKDYMKEKDIKESSVKMNVIVQEMVEADKAGVLFTANPQGLLNESVIAVGKGSCEGVVSDKVDTTSYYYNRTDKVYYYEGKEDLLSEKELEELDSIGEKAEKLFGCYLDMEFAFKGEELFLLQARPITTLKGDSPLILDNSNIVESYPGISLPLTVSFVNLVYSGVFKGVSRRVLKNDKELNKHEAVFGNMVGHANGRIYYKISNWYTVLKFLPFNKKIIPVWQEMLGVKNKGYDSTDVELNPMVRFMTYVNSFYELVSVPRHMKALEKKFKVINRDFYKRVDGLEPKELIGLFEEIREKLLNIWDVTLLNDMYAFIFTGLVKSRLKKKLGADDGYVNEYISGISNIESMKPIRALIALSYKKDKLSAKEFEKRKRKYIELYGDRNLEELKLESPTYRSNPELLDERIEGYRQDAGKLKRLYLRMKEKKEASDSNSKKRDFLTEFLAKRCAIGIAGREKSRLNRSRVYGMVRLIFNRLGESYAREGLLEDKNDIFYLTIDEAFALAERKREKADKDHEAGKTDMRKLVAARKEEYLLYEKLPAYSRLIFEDKEYDKRHRSINSYQRKRDEKQLQGIPCSKGVVTGEALVIKRVQDARDVKDKILVTKMTDPGWVFLLATAKGVLSEKGSLLSHTAIISRELKVPSIVGVENLMDTIKTGDIIKMDAGAGKIEIVRRK
ncbi:MAG: phosphoenolpyruvate synthase [Lachnospiraceae bacterium]|nr:phosphoenolpyruvate synthase [Lachnospiraceae bacterium]